jgi:hypothetical protein
MYIEVIRLEEEEEEEQQQVAYLQLFRMSPMT